MTIYLTNAIPNGWLLKTPVITPLDFEEVFDWLCEPDQYTDYDDVAQPYRLKPGVVSLVGHTNTAKSWGGKLGRWVGATHLGKSLPVEIPVNRETVDPGVADKVIAGLFVAPYRLPEGERWSEEQILSHTYWVLVEFDN